MSEPEVNDNLAGVKVVELYKLVWTKYDRYILFSGQNVTNAFGTNNLISLLPTVLYILQTALLPIYSKLSDIYGRAHCYTVALIFYMVSYIVMATAPNYYTIVGGQVIYAFGYSGTSILGPITIADLTDVVDRGLFQGLYNLPTLISIFCAPRAGEALSRIGQWRWGYGMIPILICVTSFPVVGSLWKLNFKVKKSGLIDDYKREQKIVRESENLSIMQKIVWFIIEIDVIGSLLLVTGLALILLPLVLALPSWGGWSSGTTIGTLVGGVVTWGLFLVWEWKFALKPIIPITRWESRTPLYGVLALSTVTIISSTAWQFFTTYLMVSRKLSADDAILLERGYNVAYIICEVIVGYFMKRTRVWRPFVWAGVSLTILGVGLMIPARLPTASTAFLVISQTIVGIGSGFLFVPILVAIQSSVPHGDMAIATAMMQVGGSIAASIGSTMAGTIWNNMLPGQLAKYVPGEYDYAKIVGSTVYATNLPEDQYNGVVEAYGHIQMILSIIAICIAVLTFCFTIPMKSFGLESTKDKDGKSTAGSELSSDNLQEKGDYHSEMTPHDIQKA
ncbi:hypothetical protein INT48_004920 [Thamnidium elegans]|uniref:Major facilitator superfamily (MFS) profile domain-containing protein n=1 Tax=Thamnidium elegans TaxID=101142 RepID=A0A8H7SFT6_9FUNG|nr:hypothetical protein INT48_004920 [Thamnidium elegans]